MSKDINTISGFQTVLLSHVFNTASSFSEDFAIKRFQKKFQKPSETVQSALADKCWSEWLDGDITLPQLGLLPTEWYKVRELLHKELGFPNYSAVGFSKGSEFAPTNGHNSLEAKLCSSEWTVTKSGFDTFARICFNHKGLKRSAKKRYHEWWLSKRFNECLGTSNRILFQHFRSKPETAFRIFKWKLERIVTFEEGSRFSTVPKNNEKRRPINVECFGNTVGQSTLGNWLRDELLRIFSIDLNSLAQTHRHRISAVDEVATIDLKNASDRISLDLCRFLLPHRVLKPLLAVRSEMVLGADGCYHITKKVSSMGCGFTFELMSLILTCISRQLDGKASVFGDDIIIAREKAPRLIELLTSVGLQVNDDKSFISGDFRESCGGNYHRTEGYIESYDFEWPESIGNCITIYNKVVRLAKCYPSFEVLLKKLTRLLPPALQGGPNHEFENKDIFSLVSRSFGADDSPSNFPPYFVTPKNKGELVGSERLKSALRDIQLDPGDFRVITGYKWVPQLRSQTRKTLTACSHWAKYEMYLASGRRANDVITGEGRWIRVKLLSSGTRVFLASALSN